MTWVAHLALDRVQAGIFLGDYKTKQGDYNYKTLHLVYIKCFVV